MEETYVEATFSNPYDLSKSITFFSLVDADKILTIIPESLAKDLGIKLEGRTPLITKKGNTLLGYTTLNIKIKGEEMPFNILISRNLKKVVIGMVVLESFDYKVNPVKHTLEKVELEQYHSIQNFY